MNFSQTPYFDQDFTSNASLLQAALHQTSTRGSTALYDAVVASEVHLRNNPRLNEKVLLVITDGQDNMAEALDQALRKLEIERGRPRSCSTPSPPSGTWRGPRGADFREALAATIAKSQEDRRVFELLFDRYFFRAAEAEAVQRGITERGEGGAPAPARAASGSTWTS